jgi:tricorn protease-like protein
MRLVTFALSAPYSSRMKRVFVLVTIVAGLAAAAAAHGSSAFPIAYTTWDSTEQISTISSTGGTPQPLTSSSLESADPSYSRDGKRIVFARGHEDNNAPWDIWTMNADGSDKQRVTRTRHIDERHPIWSPDGSKIAFTALGDVWVMNSDGSNRRRMLVRQPTDTAFGTPSWSPNSTKLLISDLPRLPERHMYIVSVATGKVVRALPVGAAAAWAPVGREIVFFREKSSRTQSDLWLVNADGTGLQRLTNTPTLFEVFSSWSPDGSQIAYWANKQGTQPDELSLFVMDANGSGSVELGPVITSPWWGGLGS